MLKFQLDECCFKIATKCKGFDFFGNKLSFILLITMSFIMMETCICFAYAFLSQIFFCRKKLKMKNN